jgi:hypothetical protein
MNDALRSGKPLGFSEIVPGGLYYYEESSSGYYSGVTRQRILRVARMTPTKRKAELALGPDYFDRIEAYASHYTGTFYPVSEELAGRCYLKHRDIVADAIKAGLSVPSEVRRHYPDLFVTLPEYVKAEELATLLTGWKSMTSAADIAACIESTHESIRCHDRDTMLIVRGHASQAERDKARASLLQRLDLYTWLAPLIAPGGVFAVEESKRNAA